MVVDVHFPRPHHDWYDKPDLCANLQQQHSRETKTPRGIYFVPLTPGCTSHLACCCQWWTGGQVCCYRWEWCVGDVNSRPRNDAETGKVLDSVWQHQPPLLPRTVPHWQGACGAQGWHSCTRWVLTTLGWVLRMRSGCARRSVFEPVLVKKKLFCVRVLYVSYLLPF